MASSSKQTNWKHSSSTPMVDGNLARDPLYEELRRLEESGRIDFDQEYHSPRLSEADRISRRRAKSKAAVRKAQKVQPSVILGSIVVAALMVMLVVCHIEINKISNSIVDMKKEISRLEAEQVSLEAQYEQAFDASVVKNAAMNMGMGKPSESQITYISLPGEDRVEVYTKDKWDWLK